MNQSTEQQRAADAASKQKLVEEVKKKMEDGIIKHVLGERLQEVDKWRKKQDGDPDRPEAIRRLVELGLKAKK